jgi:hypothetical protein
MSLLQLNMGAATPGQARLPQTIFKSDLAGLPTFRNGPRAIAKAREARDYDALYDELVLQTLLGTDTYMFAAPRVAKSPEPKAKAETKAKTKAKAKKVSPVIKNMLNEYPFNLFKFKTRDECKSSSRSKSYYMNKNDLVDVISNDPELSRAFPKGVKKMPKDQICDAIFDRALE